VLRTSDGLDARGGVVAWLRRERVSPPPTGAGSTNGDVNGLPAPARSRAARRAGRTRWFAST